MFALFLQINTENTLDFWINRFVLSQLQSIVLNIIDNIICMTFGRNEIHSWLQQSRMYDYLIYYPNDYCKKDISSFEKVWSKLEIGKHN